MIDSARRTQRLLRNELSRHKPRLIDPSAYIFVWITGCAAARALYAKASYFAPGQDVSGLTRYLFHDPSALGASTFFDGRAVPAIPALARRRRVRGVTPTRLQDLVRRRTSIRCYILVANCARIPPHRLHPPWRPLFLARQRRAALPRPS
jgi:hypothetical protein